MKLRIVGAVSLVAAIASGCNSTVKDSPLPPPTPGEAVSSGISSGSAAPFGSSQPPFGTPSSTTSRVQSGSGSFARTTETQRVSVSADGSTVKTTTTRTSVGFNPERAAAAVGTLLSAGGQQQGVAGMWRIQSSSNREMCSLNLYGGPDAVSGAVTSSGCSWGSIGAEAAQWRYANGRMELVKKSGEVGLTLNQLGPTRFEGRLTWGILTTTMVMFR